MNAKSALVRRGMAAVAVASLGLLAGCGSSTATPDAKPVDSSANVADAGAGQWLLRFNVAGGTDLERASGFYVRFTPKTGAAETTTMPAVTAPEASADRQAVLVNADHTLAIPDSRIDPGQAKTGQLKLYALPSGEATVLDFKAATGDAKALPVGWSFDPADAAVLRVVDSMNVVWKVDVAAKKATKEATLTKTEMQFFSNGFDANTGAPYLVRIDSDQTEPPGNGDLDPIEPLKRSGGEMLIASEGKYAGLPDPGCGYSAGFRDAQKTTWVFCADEGVVTTLRHGDGDANWEAYGKPSGKIVPPAAGEFPVVLPPA